MISNALIELDIDATETTMLSSGERVEIQYTITNQATRQDSFELSVDFIEAIGWIIEAEQRPSIVINPGSSASFYIAVTAPENAQANDVAPAFKPILTSTRSGMQYDGPEYRNIVIETLYDVELRLMDAESVLKPGATTIIGVEAINNGNGPTSATMHLVDAPESWTFSIRLDGVIQEGNSIDLGVVYSGENSIEIDVLLSIPMTEAAGEFHTITIELHPDGQDIEFSDNHVSIDMITGSVKYPEYNG